MGAIVGAALWASSRGGMPPSDGSDEPWLATHLSKDEMLPNLPVRTLGGKQLWADEHVYSGWRIQRHALTGHCRLLDPHDIRRGLGSYDACCGKLDALRATGAVDPPPSTHTVLLLHGIWRAKESMEPLEAALREEGFDAVAISYPSTQGFIEDHARQLARVVERLEGAERISFVTHSMGGLVVRRFLRDSQDPRLGRLVMIAAPNRGASLANMVAETGLLESVFGPAGPQLREGLLGATDDLPVPAIPFGVIAGGKGDGKGFNRLLDGDNDLVVEVENAKLDGMADFLLTRRTHTFIMEAPETIEAVRRFLAEGRFGDATPPPRD